MNKAVQAYFNRAADDFDAIYGEEKKGWRWLNRYFRRDMYERYDLTFETCGDIAGKTVIDIGCGSGRYSIEFAKRGAAQVVGLDFAPNMVKLAQQHAESLGLATRCFFMTGEFLQMEVPQRFDICLAVGVFDYIAHPRSFLEKMRSIGKEWLILSFPSKSLLRTPIRKARYWFKRCPVYFYDPGTIKALVDGLGKIRIVKIRGQGMDYFVAIQIGGASRVGLANEPQTSTPIYLRAFRKEK